MVLIFLLILAFLCYAIRAELDGGQETPAPSAGHCPGCSGAVEADWLLCPRCRELLRESCGVCGAATATWHSYCPHCGTLRREEG